MAASASSTAPSGDRAIRSPSIAGRGTVGFSDCTFVQWDRDREGRHALQVQSGSVLVRGCEFQENKPQIDLGEHVRRAVITDNIITGSTRIDNHSHGTVKIANNAEDAPRP